MDASAGRYELLDLIGSGGMAEVYRARMVGAAGFAKLVAIKRILADYSADDEFVRRFVDEARLTARLVHSNICQILDFGVMEGRHFIAMEYVDGQDLSGLLTGLDREHERMPLDVVLYVTACVLRGLKHAHEARDEDGSPLGIVHRDVSPHNVLLSVNGDVKLSDLGAATANPAVRSARTQKHFRLGKLLYMAPEQRRVGPIDLRADLYSTGILLAEMVLGVTRFQKIANMFLAGLSDLAAEVQETLASPTGRAIARLVEEATAEDPDRRFQSAGEMLAATDRVLVELAPGMSVDRVARLVSRLKKRRAAAGAPSLTGPVEAVSLRTGDLIDLSEPEPEPASSGALSGPGPADEEEPTLDEPLTRDLPASFERRPEPEDEVPTVGAGPASQAAGPAEQAVEEAAGEAVEPEPEARGRAGDDEPTARGLDEVPTVARPRPAAPEEPEAAEPDPVPALAPPEDEPSDRGPNEAAIATERTRRKPHRATVAVVVLGLALLAGLGVGAVFARGRLVASRAPGLGSGGSSSTVAPETPRPAGEGEPDGEQPRPVARIALEIGASRDAGSRVPEATEPRGPAPRDRPAGQAQKAAGFLNINSLPYGVPYVDGVRVAAETPVAQLKLAPGRHRVKVFFPQEGRSVERLVRIRSGETAGVVVRLEAED